MQTKLHKKDSSQSLPRGTLTLNADSKGLYFKQSMLTINMDIKEWDAPVLNKTCSQELERRSSTYGGVMLIGQVYRIYLSMVLTLASAHILTPMAVPSWLVYTPGTLIPKGGNGVGT